MTASVVQEPGVTVGAEHLHNWTVAVARRVGTPGDIAADVADVLIAGDLRGIASHGTARLPVYISLIEGGVMDPLGRPSIDGGTEVMRVWDARNGWGQHAGRVLMDDAIDRARSLGLAASLARHANHFGIAGWYAMRAASQGLIGICMTNTSPLVAPTRGRTPLLGTNPIAVAAPAGRHGLLVLDMATSTVTWGHLLVASRRGQEIAPGVAIDADGRPTVSPMAALRGGALLPLGGAEETRGYKGYGLALIVDILTGVLAGAIFGPHVVPVSLTEGPSNLGQQFMAIDPTRIGSSGFVDRLEMFVDELTTAPTALGAPGPVLMPGQPEQARELEQQRSGILLDAAHHRALCELADRLGIPFPPLAAQAHAPAAVPTLKGRPR
jgi:LDH2 family malate/lactate/ureidoglycolate dehydrogenase